MPRRSLTLSTPIRATQTSPRTSRVSCVRSTNEPAMRRTRFEQGPPDRPRRGRRSWRIRRHWRARLQQPGGGRIRVPVALDRADRRGRDRNLRRDVRPGRDDHQAPGLRCGAAASRLRPGPRHSDRERGNQHPRGRRRGRRDRPDPPALLRRPPVQGSSADRRDRDHPPRLGPSVRGNRAHLRLRRPLPGRLHRRRGPSAPGLGSLGEWLSAALADGREHPDLLVFRRGGDRLGDGPVRGLLLLVRRHRGGVGRKARAI